MGDALRLAEVSSNAAEADGQIDLERPFVLTSEQSALGGSGSTRTPLLGHVLSLVTRTMGLLGGVKLGLAQGTSRYRSAHLSDSGACGQHHATARRVLGSRCDYV